MSDYNRNKINRTFWFAAKEAGMSREDVTDYVGGMFKGKSVSQLTIDELAQATQELIKTHNLDIGTPWLPERNQRRRNNSKQGQRNQGYAPKKRNSYSRFEPASPKQLNLVDILSQEIGLTDNAFVKLLVGMGWDTLKLDKNKNGMGGLTIKVGRVCKKTAQNMIEALKAMIAEGWKPENPDQLLPGRPVTFH